MSYKIYIYALMLFVTVFSVSGINYNNLFKKNHVIEARIFVMLIIISLTYLSASFIINFIELT